MSRASVALTRAARRYVTVSDAQRRWYAEGAKAFDELRNAMKREGVDRVLVDGTLLELKDDGLFLSPVVVAS